MGLTVLTDEQIAGLLNNLTADELESFRTVLKNALYEYSTGTQSAHTSEVQQPPRTALLVPDRGTTTLFMPSYSPQGIGMKVITLHKPKTPETPAARPTGAITLYSSAGSPLGILHASTLTAFRTALASMCLLVRRDDVRDITVFGCGEQAYWHVRLALLLRGSTVRHVNIIGRRFDACRDFVARIYRLPAALKAREGWADTKFSILTSSYTEYARLLQSNLRSADVIFCCTPSSTPLFDHKILTAHQGRKKGRLIVAIGSFTHDMQELPVELLQQATRHGPAGHHGGSGDGDGQHRHYHKHAVEGGVIVVDTLDGALKESGEIIAAGLPSRSLVELGELVMLSRIKLQDEDEEDGAADDASEDLRSGATTRSPSVELDRLTLSPVGGGGNAMSLVYGKGDTAEDAKDAKDAKDTKDDDAQSVKSSVASVLRSGLAHISSSSSSNVTTAASKKNSFGGSTHSRTHSRSHSHSHHRASSTSLGSLDRRNKKKEAQETHSARWLQRGNVIYKSVGLGLMDLSVGTHLISFARQKGVGTHVEGF